MKPKKEEKIEYVDYGYVNGVYMSSEVAYHYYKMCEKGLDLFIEINFAGKMGRESVKLYIEALEKKIKEAKKVAAKYENGIE